MGDKPTRDKVIVISIELVLAPALGLEAFEEERALQDSGPECTGTPGHAGCSAIDSMGRRYLEIAAFNVAGAQPIVQSFADLAISYTLHTLICTDCTNFRVLEWCQNPRHDSSWPRDIIISHYDERCFHMRDCLANLDAFVGNRYMKSSDVGCLEGLRKFDELGVLVRGRHQKQLTRLASENALKRFPQLLKVVMNSGHYYRDIV